MGLLNENARIAENPAPYDVLTARVALVEAAKLNRRALTAMNGNGIPGDPALAVQMAQIAQALSTYALALSRWTT